MCAQNPTPISTVPTDSSPHFLQQSTNPPDDEEMVDLILEGCDAQLGFKYQFCSLSALGYPEHSDC